MTQDEVLSMARAAGFEFNKYGLLVADDDGETDADEMFVRFAALVAAAEREACAAACEAVKQRAEELAKSDFATREGKGVFGASASGAHNCMLAIRARGTNAN